VFNLGQTQLYLSINEIFSSAPALTWPGVTFGSHPAVVVAVLQEVTHVAITQHGDTVPDKLVVHIHRIHIYTDTVTWKQRIVHHVNIYTDMVTLKQKIVYRVHTNKRNYLMLAVFIVHIICVVFNAQLLHGSVRLASNTSAFYLSFALLLFLK